MTRATPVWLEAQYNHRARVSNSAELLRRWAQASALARQRSAHHLDLPYGSGADASLDLFLPDSREPAPVLVFIHGGYWRSLDKSDHSFIAPVFTDEGALVVVPNYSLCPGVAMERIPLQLTQALAWVWRHIADYGGDASRIVLVGHSAGAHLASMLLCCDWKTVGSDLPRHLVQGALGLSGLYDLAPLLRTPFLQSDLRLDASSARRLSPLHYPAPQAPLYAVAGAAESEEAQRQTRSIRQAWGARAVPVCELLPGLDHFTLMHDLADPQGRCHQLARHLLALRWYSGLL